MNTLHRTLFLLFSLLLTACAGSGSGRTPETGTAQSPQAARLPGILELDKLNETSIAGFSRLGKQYLDASPESVIEENSLRLGQLAGQSMYAIYQFDSTSAEVLSSVGYVTSDKASLFSKIHVLLADYQLGRWRLITVDEKSGILPLSSTPGQYSSPGGHTYIALLGYDGEYFVLDTVEVYFENLIPDSGAWPTAGGSNLRQGYSADNVVENANIHWKVQLSQGLIHSAPVQSGDGTVYIGSYDPVDQKGKLYAVDPQGQLKWQYEALDHISATPAIGPQGHVLFGDLVRNMYAVNPEGVRAWLYRAQHAIHSPVAVLADGSLIFGTQGSQLFKLDYIGNEQWHLDVSSGIYGAAAVADDGTIYVCTSGGNLLSVSPAGALNWEFDGVGEVPGSPCLTPAGTLVYASQDGNIYAVDADGNQLGMDGAGGSFNGSPALGPDGNVYIGNMDGKLYKYDAGANLIGSFDAEAPLEGSVVIDGDGTIFLGTTGGTLFAINPALDIQWQHETGGTIRAGLAIGADGILLLPTVEGLLTAFAPNDPVAPATPTGLAASQGLYADAVRLSWDEQFDADSYEIYRNGGGVPFATVGYVTEWFDTGLLDDTVHDYTIVAVNDTGSSAASDVASGYANAVQPGAGEWNMFAADAANSGNCSLSGPHTEKLAWEYPTGIGSFGSVVIGSDGELYFPTGFDDPGVVSVAADASFRWRYEAAGELGSCLAIDDDGYIYGGQYEAVFRLTPAGSEDWSASYSNKSFGPPTLSGSSVLICGAQFGGTEITVDLDSSDGSENWSYPEGSRNCAPAIGATGLIYVGSDSNRIYIINPDGSAGGELGGNASLDGSAVVLPDLVLGDQVLFVSGPTLYAYLDGTFDFSYPADNDDVTGMAFLPDGLSVATIGDECSRIDLAGTESWSAVPSDKTFYAMPAVDADGYIYYGDSAGIFRCISPAGAVVWDYDTGTDLRYCTPAIGPAGRVYVLGSNGTLYAFEPADP